MKSENRRFACRYCGKKFIRGAMERNEHEKDCKKRPGADRKRRPDRN